MYFVKSKNLRFVKNLGQLYICTLSVCLSLRPACKLCNFNVSKMTWFKRWFWTPWTISCLLSVRPFLTNLWEIVYVETIVVELAGHAGGGAHQHPVLGPHHHTGLRAGSVEKIYSDWLFIQVGMKEAHIILITEWLVLFCGINKKITANGEVITNLWPTLQEDQNDLLVFKKYTLSKPKLRYFTDLTNYLLSIEDPMLDSQELIVF